MSNQTYQQDLPRIHQPNRTWTSQSEPVFPSRHLPLPSRDTHKLPRSMELDPSSNNLHRSRTSPDLLTGTSALWPAVESTNYPIDLNFGDPWFYKSRESTTQHLSSATQQVPLDHWVRDDGPWTALNPDVLARDPFPESSDSRHASTPYDNGDRAPRHRVPPSDSGYGTVLQSVGTTSVFSGDLNDRDQDSPISLDFHLRSRHQEVFERASDDPTLKRSTSKWLEPASSPSKRQKSMLTCLTCHKPVKTRSELKKHFLRHKRPFKCKVAGCPKLEGFSTPNDLERHIKSKHPDVKQSVSQKRWRCLVPDCKSTGKSWPRVDNFRSHVNRLHKTYLEQSESLDQLVNRGEFVQSDSRTGLGILNTHGSSLGPSDSFNSIDPEDPREFEWSNWDERVPGFPESSHHLSPATVSVLESHWRSHESVSASRHAFVQYPHTVELRASDYVESPAGDVQELRRVIPIDPALTPPVLACKITLQRRNNRSGHLGAGSSGASGTTVLQLVKQALAAAEKSEDRTDIPVSDLKANSVLLARKRKHSSSEHNEKPSVGADQDGSRTCPSAIEADLKFDDSAKKVITQEVFNILRDLGYQVQKNSPPDTQQQAPLRAGGVKPERKVTCQKCNKFTGRPCEVKKHMKRHSKPYACTFPNCAKSFGSKNDWRRHEDSQHLHLEVFRCSIVPGKEGGICGKTFERRQLCQDHLRRVHGMKDENSIKEKLLECREDSECPPSFWCGFCIKNVAITARGPKGWTERFDHIDDHFMGRNLQKSRTISDWKHAGGRDTTDAAELVSKTLQQRSGDNTNNAIFIVDGQEQVSKSSCKNGGVRERTVAAVSYVVVCCQCKSPNNAELAPKSCNTCIEMHDFCDDCDWIALED